MKSKIYGDFQTPIPLASQVINALKQDGITFGRVLEPTCGVGNFIQAILELEMNSEIIGIELQSEHVKIARERFQEAANIEILESSIFNIHLKSDLQWRSEQPLLIVGNPPWVNNSTIGTLNGDNLPQKSNFKKLEGINAITGASNFDIAEFIWLKLIIDLAETPATIALLCKTSVARNVLQYAREAKLPINNATIRHIDSKFWFDVAVDACLFTVSVNNRNGVPTYQADVYKSLESFAPDTTIGFVGDAFVSDTKLYKDFSSIDLLSTSNPKFTWRAGIKHDASSIMELRWINNNWVNGFNEVVDVESEYLYPLLKSSDVKNFTGKSTNKAMIVTQKKVGENTNHLENKAPKLWQYLNKYKPAFMARKSSIYKNKPNFSIFGVGDYTFSPYKVIVSGFYKIPFFTPVGELEGKQFVCDDTCYSLAFSQASEAIIVAAALNHSTTRRFLSSITFEDAKRPFTKDTLSRIDIGGLLRKLPKSELVNQARWLGKYLLTSSEIEQLVRNFDQVLKSLDGPEMLQESSQLELFK